MSALFKVLSQHYSRQSEKNHGIPQLCRSYFYWASKVVKYLLLRVCLCESNTAQIIGPIFDDSRYSRPT